MRGRCYDPPDEALVFVQPWQYDWKGGAILPHLDLGTAATRCAAHAWARETKAILTPAEQPTDQHVHIDVSITSHDMHAPGLYSCIRSKKTQKTVVARSMCLQAKRP